MALAEPWELNVLGRPRKPSQFALQFFAVSAGAFGVAAGLGALLVWLGLAGAGSALFPPVFWASTAMLLLGSSSIHAAVERVRRERQRRFRNSLRLALAAGTAFVGLQGAGLIRLQDAALLTDASTGVAAFVLVLTFLHALHFTVALMFLVFVTLRAHNDRYDHEYYWGVVVCGYFWHFLGVVWLGILCVFALAT